MLYIVRALPIVILSAAPACKALYIALLFDKGTTGANMLSKEVKRTLLKMEEYRESCCVVIHHHIKKKKKEEKKAKRYAKG